MSHLFHSERTHTFAFQVQHRRRAGAGLCEKQCAPTLSLFCRSHRRAQSRLTSAIFASVILAGSSICRTKCKAYGSANPFMESRVGAGQDFILLLWRSKVCSAPCQPCCWRRSRHPLHLLPRDRLGTGGTRLPCPASPHRSAALPCQAVAVQVSLAAGSRSGGDKVANARVAVCRSVGIRCLPCSEARCIALQQHACRCVPACILCTFALRHLRVATMSAFLFSLIGIHTTRHDL
jgi:hypothetical protein